MIGELIENQPNNWLDAPQLINDELNKQPLNQGVPENPKEDLVFEEEDPAVV